MKRENEDINSVDFVYESQTFHFMCQRTGDHILRTMTRTNSFYEADVLSYCRSLCPKPVIVIDAGGYIGTHSVFYGGVMKAEAVITFEPDTENFEDLQKNIHKNNLDGRVYTLNMGAGEKECKGRISQASVWNRGASTLVEGHEGGIKIIPIDQLFSEDEVSALKGKEVSLIKIDVEGMEKEVISGALQTIKKYRPVIVFECHQGAKFHEILKILQPMKYVVVNCLGRSPTYIAVPSDKGSKIKNSLWLLLSYTQTIRLWLYTKRLGFFFLKNIPYFKGSISL